MATTSAASATASNPADVGSSVNLQNALVQFAHALAAALRGGHGDDDSGEGRGGHGHHHRHHHGSHGQDPSARLGALAARLAADTSPAPPAPTATDAASAAALAGSSAAATGATSASALDVAVASAAASANTPAEPAAAAPATPTIAAPAATATTAPDVSAAAADSSLVVVAFPQAHGGKGNSPFAGYLDRLMDSFARLQQAMEKPAAKDEKSLQAALAAFLRDLAARLAGEAGAPVTDPTAPGALIDVAA
jgi:hypothetical protein